MKPTLLTTLLFVSFLASGQRNQPKPITELIDRENSGWDVITSWKESATNQVEVLPKDPMRADSALYQLQLKTNSPLAAMVHGCGGMLVDHGWIRILGSGCKQLDRSLPGWNKGKSTVHGGEESYLLVADDVLGGFFAINEGGIDEYDIGKVFYFGPNKLQWETTGLGYNEFLVFCFSREVGKFYRGFRWTGWQDEVAKLNGNQVISCYPLLWTDAGKNLSRNRKVVAVQKQWDLYGMQNRVVAKKIVKKNARKPPKIAQR